MLIKLVSPCDLEGENLYIFIYELKVEDMNLLSFNCVIVLLQLTLTLVYIAVGVFAAGWIGNFIDHN